MNVAGTTANRLDQEEVAKGDDRRLFARQTNIVNNFVFVFVFGNRCNIIAVDRADRFVVEVAAFKNFFDEGLRLEMLLDERFERTLGARHHDEFSCAGAESNVVDGRQVVRIHHRDVDRVSFFLYWNSLVLADQLARDEFEHRLVWSEIGQLDDFHAGELSRERGLNLPFGAELEIDQD